MPRKLPLHPAHPERICWGCDKYCAADDLRCGNGTDRAQHPAEILGDDWMDYGLDADAERAAEAEVAPIDSDAAPRDAEPTRSDAEHSDPEHAEDDRAAAEIP